MLLNGYGVAGKLFIISAPSGAGKTTLVNAVLRDFTSQYQIERVITYTSKVPRPSEVHGVDYHFMPTHEFEAKIKEGFFIEWSMAYGNYYGSPCHILDDIQNGKSYIAILDRVGAQAVIARYPEAILIWIKVPDIESLRCRLANRGQDSQEQVAKRLILAQQEIEEEAKKPLFHHYIFNDFFENAVKSLKNIINASIDESKGATR